jgi:diguanylate cyclase (GGDEF)-like protein
MTGLPTALTQVIGLSGGALDTLMPMHVWADDHGRIVQAGPTVLKMIARAIVSGEGLFDLIDIRRPARVTTVPDLLQHTGRKLAVALRSAPDLPLRGTVTGLQGGAGIILNLSLGLSFVRAVAEFGLTLNDFSPSDQTVELLYLHEANQSAARLSRHLTERLENARRAAEEQALTDTLTGLSNRRAMDMELARLLAEPNEDFGLLHLDLDFFKQVNDTLGHAAGDHVLGHVASALKGELRRADMAARVGGDEFVLLVRDCDDAARLCGIADRLIRQIEAPIRFDGQPCRISASVGIAMTAAYDPRPTADRLLNDADIALYAAKHAGRGRHMTHAELAPEARPDRRRTDLADNVV